MIYPSADKLDAWGSKYAITVLAAKRAKQVKIGFAPLVDTDSRNPLTISLEEIGAGEITAVPIVVEKPATLPEFGELGDGLQTTEELLGGLDELPLSSLDSDIDTALEADIEDEADYIDDEPEVKPLDEVLLVGGDDDLVVEDGDEIVEEEPAFEGSEVELDEESEDSWKSEDDLEE